MLASFHHQGSREQLAIAEFASALLTIPKTLAINAAKDSTDLVAKLRAYHNAAQNALVGDPKRGLMMYGLDLINGEVRDNRQAGVLEPTISKIKSLKSALEAATSLLRIDDSITVGESLVGTSTLLAASVLMPCTLFCDSSGTKERGPPRSLESLLLLNKRRLETPSKTRSSSCRFMTDDSFHISPHQASRLALVIWLRKQEYYSLLTI